MANLLILGAWLKQNKNVTQAKLEAPSCYAIQNALAYFATLTPILTNQVKDLHRVTNS